MGRQARLQSATTTAWVRRYAGKNIVKGYSNWFAVDPLCAIIELRRLGVAIEEQYEKQIRLTQEIQVPADQCAETSPAESDLKAGFTDTEDLFDWISGHAACTLRR
jgi:hypothetical protein